MKTRMKIAICGYQMGCGGTEKAMLALLNAIDPEKADVTLYLMFNKGPLYDEIPDYVTVKEIPFKAEKYRYCAARDLVSSGIKYYYRKIVRKLFKLSHSVTKDDGLAFEKVLPYCESIQEEYDIAGDFHGYGEFPTVWVREILKAKKYATWVHDEDFHWLSRTIDWLPKYDRIYSVSQAVKNNFDSAYPQLKDRSQLFYNILRPDQILIKGNEKAEELSGDNILVTVGRICNQKGCDLAVDVASILKERGISYKWYFVGEGVWDEKIRALIIERHLENEVFMLGRKSNPYPYMKNATVYVQPSRHEGFGLTIYEAKVLNAAIVATDIPCFHEQIENGTNGVMCEFDAEAFAAAIIRLLGSEEERERLKENIRSERLDYIDEVNKLYDLMEQA